MRNVLPKSATVKDYGSVTRLLRASTRSDKKTNNSDGVPEVKIKNYTH